MRCETWNTFAVDHRSPWNKNKPDFLPLPFIFLPPHFKDCPSLAFFPSPRTPMRLLTSLYSLPSAAKTLSRFSPLASIPVFPSFPCSRLIHTSDPDQMTSTNDNDDGQVQIHPRRPQKTQAELEKEKWQEAHRLACEVNEHVQHLLFIFLSSAGVSAQLKMFFFSFLLSLTILHYPGQPEKVH